MIKIRIEDSGVRDLLTRLQVRAGNLSPVMRRIAGIMKDAVEENFAREGRPAWKKLSDSTLAGGFSFYKRDSKYGKKGSVTEKSLKKFVNRKILQDTGRLAASISGRATKDQAIVGTNVVYAAIHQFGGSTGPRIIRPKGKKALFWPGAKHPVTSVKHPGSKIPARPFLHLERSDIEDIKTAMVRYLTGR